MATPQEPPRESLAQRAEELESLRQSEHDSVFAGDQRDMTGELTTVDQHPADTADILYQRELQQTTADILEREAQQARDALDRGEQGQYGICSSCGKQISPERLQARPSATLCIDCQRAAEDSRPNAS